MTAGSIKEFDELIRAWREFEARAPAIVWAIGNDRHLRAMVRFMNKFVDRIADQDNPPLEGLLNIVAALLHDYEERNVKIPDAGPSAALRFLMDQRGLCQANLAGELGSQLSVSEVLNGKREISVRQACALTKRFAVSPAVFI
jgi:HTH-type transcriptional regulator/antitoxin HigA